MFMKLQLNIKEILFPLVIYYPSIEFDLEINSLENEVDILPLPQIHTYWLLSISLHKLT